MEKQTNLGGRETLALVATWTLALAAGVVWEQLEIFLLSAPLSAGIYFLMPRRA